MEELIKLQELESSNTEEYLRIFNNLSDEEITSVFETNKLSSEIKNKLIEIASDRINKLPNSLFIEISTWETTKESYIKNYLKRIQEMSYEEFVELLFNGIYDQNIAIEIMKTNTYKQHLQKEKEEQKENNLQCLDCRARLFTSTNILEDLNKIGQKILALKMWESIESSPEKRENIEGLENAYLKSIIENRKAIDLNEKSIKCGLGIIGLHMQKQELLTPKMIEFYLYYRIKELNLESICKNVIVTLDIGEEESKMFGHYTMDGDILKGGTLRINYEYLINIFSRVNKTIGISDKQLNDVININFLEMLSHELGHAMDMQNFFKITENLDAVDWLMTTYTNKHCNYNLRSTELQDKMGTKEYRKHHNIFITEYKQTYLPSLILTSN